MILKYLSPCINLKAAGTRILKYGLNLPCVQLFLVFFLFDLFLFHRRSSTSARAAAAESYLISFLSPSSFLFFIFLFFFSGPDLHCLASANKLSRGPPCAEIPLSLLLFLLARTGNERNSPLRPYIMAFQLLVQMYFISFFVMND